MCDLDVADLFTRYNGYLFCVLADRNKDCPRELVEDALGELWTKLLSSKRLLEKYDPSKSKIITYLLTLAKQQLKDVRLSESRRKKRELARSKVDCSSREARIHHDILLTKSERLCLQNLLGLVEVEYTSKESEWQTKHRLYVKVKENLYC